MQESQDPIESIIQDLRSKSVVKQRTYNYLCQAFNEMMTCGKLIVKQIQDRVKDVDEGFTVEFKKISNQEFHIKVAGDLIIFVLHTNIVTYSDEHGVVKSKYVAEDNNRRYFGQIMMYNFMADSVKYNRMEDPGYLLGRVLLNYENHFFIEGEGQLDFLFNQVSTDKINKVDIDVIIKIALTTAAKSDLVTPSYQEIKFITLYDKVESTQSMGGGRKIGFKMSYDQKIS